MTGYTTQDVARLIGLTAARIRAFARDGFLTPARGARGEWQFSFQDLVILRTAKGLVEQRVPTRRIRAALRRLRQQLPRGRSLAELRVSAEGDRIVVEDGQAAWNPESGQFQLDFHVADLATRARPLARRAAAAARRVEQSLDAEDWHELGLELELIELVEQRERAVVATKFGQVRNPAGGGTIYLTAADESGSGSAMADRHLEPDTPELRARWGQFAWTPENAAENVVLRPERLGQPKGWRGRHMVFVNSMSDLFHPRVPGDFIASVFKVMEACPHRQILKELPATPAQAEARS